MKITFLNPPVWHGTRSVDRVYGCTYALYPIPNIVAMSYAAVLENAGHEVSYLDAPNEKIKPASFLKIIKKDESDAFSMHTTNLSQHTDSITLKEIRKLRPSVWIIFTGPAPTDRPDEFLMDDRVVVARGEADFILRDLFVALSGREVTEEKLRAIKGLSFRSNGRNIHNVSAGLIEDIDVLPFPARHLMKKGLYHNPKLPNEPVTTMITSRNCAFQCIFCIPNSIGFAREIEYKRYHSNANVEPGILPVGYGKHIKPPVRKRSAKKVIEEFELIKKEGYGSVSIADDQFLWEEDRTLEICEGIEPLKIMWGCLARADRVSHATARAMAKSGCRYVDFGVESMNPETLKYINKGITAEKIEEGIKILQEHGIKVKVNMLIGADPNETEEQIWRSINKIFSINPEKVMFSIVSPYPGTKFYDIARKEGILNDNKFSPVSVHNTAITSLKHLTSEDLERIIRQANYAFLTRWNVLRQNLWRLKKPRSAVSALLAIKEKLLR